MGTNSTPPIRKCVPKEKRGVEETADDPMVAIKSPKRAEIKPLTLETLPIADIRVKPKNTNPKYSAGPNAKAILAKGGAKKMSIIVLKTPPREEEKIYTPNALPACPFMANG